MRAALAPIDASWLSALRTLFGLAMSVSMARFLAYGWVDELLLRPKFRFHYWGFAWVEPLEPHAMHALFVALVVLASMMALGAAFRVSAVLFAAGLSYVQLLDVSTYLNHYYLAALLSWLLACSPAGKFHSVDAWLRARGRPDGSRGAPTVARAWQHLFRIQIAAVYLFAAIAKLQSDWLVHGQPLGIWLGTSTSLPIVGRWLALPGVSLAMSWMGFLFDGSIVFWLLWPRSRVPAYSVLLLFHAVTRLLFDIGMFPIIMSIGATVFFSPHWPHTWLRFFGLGNAPPDPQVRAVHTHTASLRRTLALATGAAYCVVQLVLPLRCFLYGGNVLWHEQGMRFSWRVMVRAKGGSTTFFVTRKADAKVWIVNPSDYLMPHQENEMASQPDLILQLGHHIGRDFAARQGPVEVRVEAIASLNARRGAHLIDPRVDLLTVADGLSPAPWISPAPVGPPPATHPVL